MKTITLYILALSSLLLSGCSQKIQDVSATFNETAFGIDDVELSAEHINSLPYASAFVKINDGATIFMVLALAEPNPVTGVIQLKWMSSDNAMIVTENGRIVKTLALPHHNLAQLQNTTQLTPSVQPDFATLLAKQASWQATYDWMPNYHYGYQATVTPLIGQKSVLTSPIWEKEVTSLNEYISFPALDAQFTNQYWIDDKGRVAKSIQFLGPEMGTIEMLILKPFQS